MIPAIDARGLRKSYGPVAALRGVDLRVLPGELLCLMGPNGAGKTTLLRLLAMLARPSAGSLHLLGEPADPSNLALRNTLGVISHQLYLFPQLSAAENLTYFGRLYGLRDLPSRVEQALEEVELGQVGPRAVAEFSRGMQQRVAIARAVLHDPAIVLLDEPFTGLDPHGAALLTRMLARLKDGRRTLVLVTHLVEQGVGLADRLAIVGRGRLLHDQPLGGMSAAEIASLYVQVVGGGGP